MVPQSTNSLAHFLHPPHKLTEITVNASYKCDGCKIAGTGTRFSCTICNFNLHVYCAKCPTNWIISTTNHPHQLSLFVNKPKPNQTQPCQVCHNHIEGLAYHCKGCNFMLHPLCATTSSGSDSKRPDPEDVVELGTTLVYATVAEANNGFSFDASNSSSVYEVPTSSSSGSNTSRGDDGGIFEAIIRGIGHMFEASSS